MIAAARWILFFTVVIIAATSLMACTSANACDRCGLFGNRCAFRHVAVQQVVSTPIVYPQVNFFVGAPIREEAVVKHAIESLLAKDPDYAAFQRFKQWQSQGNPPLADKPTEAVPVTSQPPVANILAQKCGTCHGGDAPKKGLLFDGTAKLTAEQALQAMRAIQAGTMPPKNKLTPEEAGDVFHSLLDLTEAK